MANNRQSNCIFVDSAGELSTIGQKVAMILFTASNSGDELILKETSSGASKVKVVNSVADETKVLDFTIIPLVFTNGIYVDTISSGATATIIIAGGGRDVP